MLAAEQHDRQTEARILNFEAYTNRALIANEVSIAQLVSLDSWFEYNYEITQWLDNYFGWIPYVGEVLNTIATGMQEAASAIKTYLVPPGIYAIEAMNTGLESARDLENAVGAFAANGIAAGVANANQTTFGNRYDEQPEIVSGFSLIAAGANEYAWYKFTDPYAGDQRKDAKKVILNSRDPFSTHRGNGLLFSIIDTASAIASGGGWIAPSIHAEPLHAEPLDAALADYPPVTAPTTQELRLALSNSLGFGGTNVCLVLGRP